MTSNNAKRELVKNKFRIEFQDTEYVKHFILESQRFYQYFGEPMAMIPEEVILDWSEFIEDCAAGYSDIPPEFDNDLDIVRTEIDPMLESELLKKYEEHLKFRSIIDQLDEKFKELTFELKHQPLEGKWWKKKNFKEGRKRLCRFFQFEQGSRTWI